jgi:hypothetical protein
MGSACQKTASFNPQINLTTDELKAYEREATVWTLKTAIFFEMSSTINFSGTTTPSARFAPT